MHARSFRVSVIHRTLTSTTGSLACVSDHSYPCIYTRGGGTPTTSQHNIFHSEKIFFLCTWRGSNLWSWNPLDLEAYTLYQLSHPVTPAQLAEQSQALWRQRCECSAGTERVKPWLPKGFKIQADMFWSCWMRGRQLKTHGSRPVQDREGGVGFGGNLPFA